jgi:demethylmenaquinone methyltransferase / 2-methoxy-6-polyprenyl-1,4-benzoquinol methylase
VNGNTTNQEIGKPLGPNKADSYRMFDRIYKRYDLLNRLFSFGQDISWRKKVAKEIDNTEDQHLLDLASGTGDVAFTILKKRANVAYAQGFDMSFNMLNCAKQKALKQSLTNRIAFTQGDASSIPYKKDSFDATTMAFGIRNIVDPTKALKEIHRVLKTGGKTLILEFSLPNNKLTRKLHLFYLRKIIPYVGAVISKDKHAYRYLNETIETFPYGQDFCDLMATAGFKNISHTPLTLGVATLYRGTK